MTITRVDLTQTSNSQALLRWEADSLPTVLGWQIESNEDGAGNVVVADPLETAWVALNSNLFLIYPINHLVAGQTLQFQVTDNSEPGSSFGSNELTLIDVDAEYTYGQVDYLYAGAPRYTTLAAVKSALEINDTAMDTDILQAINAAELQIDVWLERSFPDTGTNPQIPGVPAPISLWALSASIGTLKLRDQVFGSAGVDDWLGSIDVADQVARALVRNPMARGYRIAWGIA